VTPRERPNYDPKDLRRIVVGITGASGAAYARRLLEVLGTTPIEVHLIVTPHGERLWQEELPETDTPAVVLTGAPSARLVRHTCDDVGALPASGSFQTDGMVVCPCSMNTLAKVAAGMSGNLLERAAAVTLKERRPLILVPREMPWTRLDLLNALRLQEAGAVICPACPGFYLHPQSVADLVDFVVGKVLDLLGVPHPLATRWKPGGTARPAREDGKS